MESNEGIKDFYDFATMYCALITEDELNREAVPRLIVVLSQLYACGLVLPELQPETDDGPEPGPWPHRVNISNYIYPFYYSLPDPYSSEPDLADLRDDLADIARDLNCGIREYDAGRVGNAVFFWKFGLDHHFGTHLVNALAALHEIRTRNLG